MSAFDPKRTFAVRDYRATQAENLRNIPFGHRRVPFCDGNIVASGDSQMSNRAISIVSGAAFILSASRLACAADMAVKAPPPPPAPGCYIGGNVGGLWGRDTTTMDLSDPEPVVIGLTGLVAAGAIRP